MMPSPVRAVRDIHLFALRVRRRELRRIASGRGYYVLNDHGASVFTRVSSDSHMVGYCRRLDKYVR